MPGNDVVTVFANICRDKESEPAGWGYNHSLQTSGKLSKSRIHDTPLSKNTIFVEKLVKTGFRNLVSFRHRSFSH